MSTHRHSLRGYRNTWVPLFLIGCGLLLALQLSLASAASASVHRSLTAVSGTPIPKDAAGAPKDQGFALARVSVVRLLVSYTDPVDPTKTVANCTGLGVLVKSASAGNGPNDLVLTDSSLLDKTQAICANQRPAGTLTLVQISFNTTYGSKSQPIRIDLNSPFPLTTAIACSSDPCSTGLALIAFPGDLVPFVDVTSSSARAGSPTANDPQAIGLTNQEGTVTFPAASDSQVDLPKYTSALTPFLIPQFVDTGNADDQPEVGTPFIDAAGHLTKLQLARGPVTVTPDTLSNLIKSNPAIAAISVFSSNTDNSVNSNWKQGIAAYYAKNYATASKSFQQAAKDNAKFQGASDFENSAKKAATLLSATPVPLGTVVIPGLNLSVELWQLSIPVLLFLVLLFLLLWLLLRSRVERRRDYDRELHDAERRSEAVVQQMDAVETAQRNLIEQNRMSEQSTFPVQQQALQDKTLVRQPPREIHCPSCGEVVMPDANYCPNCRQFLSPTESGLHRRIRLPASPAQPSLPTQPSVPAYTNSPSHPVPPPPSMAPIGSVADQPTMVPLPMSPTDPVVEPSPLQRASNVTMKFADLPLPNEMTVPLKRLGFMVGTRSDPGIKRKYKPNEDSLLAAQGLVSMPVPQPFGLFVVADGMGGHANGQDASRLAIQMIVENVLPKLVANATGSMDYAKVLVDGIQSANQAVHQQNMDKRGDMGTTITSALVVGPLAYVVNVGDSRTYLYRESKGLQKVTNDHSVVASLVDAGIIKPDDIYTHPKRNQIYRSLGEKANVEIDEFTVQLHQGDKLLLCSDGLWDMVRDPKIEEVIKRPVPDPSMTGDALIQSALEGGGEDNVSVIVVQMTEGRSIEALPRLKVLAKPDTVQLPQF